MKAIHQLTAGFTKGEMIDYYADNSPLAARLEAEEVGNTAAFLASPLASGITATMVHVDKGFHAMAIPADVDSILGALGKAREPETK